MRYRQQRRIGQKPSTIVILAVLVCLGIVATMRATNATPQREGDSQQESPHSLVAAIKQTMEQTR